MFTCRLHTDVTADRRVTIDLPPETPIGKVEVVVVVVPESEPVRESGALEQHFGAVHSGHSASADNESIDRDLANAYGNSKD